MPTVHREDGIAFRIYPKDHEPPHVHAVKAGGFAKIEIGDMDSRPRVLKLGRELKDADLLKAVRIIERRWHLFMAAWRKVHGEKGPDG